MVTHNQQKSCFDCKMLVLSEALDLGRSFLNLLFVVASAVDDDAGAFFNLASNGLRCSGVASYEIDSTT